jgi:hypothetical protein
MGMRIVRFPGRPRQWLLLFSTAAVVAATVTAVMVTTVTPAAGATGIPAFYVTINDGALHTAAPQVEVHNSSDGAVTGTLPAPARWRIESISAAASDRTFFVAESTPGLCPADRFLEFGVTDSGVPAGLHQVGVDASGMLGPLAASPDGTRLAYTTVCTTPANPGPTWVLHVMDLASGAVSTWTNAVTTATPADVAEGGVLAWTADGRSLSFGYQWVPSQAAFGDEAVVLVNVASGSGTLQAHSRLVWHQSAPCWPGSCAYSAWINPAGTALLAEAFGGADAPGTFALEHLSLPAGRVTAVLFRAKTPKTAAGIWEGPAWTDSSGTYWLLDAGTQFGWVRQGHFHPLQPATSVADAAW